MKPLPRLRDMPYHVKQRIAEHVCNRQAHIDYYDKMSLQTAYPEFRQFIGDPHLPKGTIELALRETGHVELALEDMREEIRKTYADLEEGVIGDLEMAARDFKMLVDNPNCGPFGLTVRVEGPCSDFLSKIQRILQNRQTPLSVRAFYMYYGGDEADVLRILSYLNPIGLVKLALNSDRGPVYQLDEVMKLEHWRRADLILVFGYFYNTLPLELFVKNTRRDLTMKTLKLTDFRKMLKLFRRTPNFVSWGIDTNFKVLDIARALGGERAGFESLEDGQQYSYFARTDTKNAVHVYIRNGHVEFRSHYLGWEDGQPEVPSFYKGNPGGDEEEEEEEENEEVDKVKRIMRDLRNRFCKQLEAPVTVGVDQGVLKHFEWDREAKTWRKVDCVRCEKSEQDLEWYYKKRD